MDDADLTQCLAGYEPQTLATWFVELNGFRWPRDFPIPMPSGYEQAPRRDAGGRDRYTLQAPVMRVLRDLTSPEDRSRAWWGLALGRPDAAWQDWWDGVSSAALATEGRDVDPSA